MDEQASFEPRAVLGRRAGWDRLAVVVPVVALIGVDVAGFVAELGIDADVRTFCDRSGVLVSTPNPAGSMPALPVGLTPGVVVPPEITNPDAAPAEVILIGRLGKQADQASSG